MPKLTIELKEEEEIILKKKAQQNYMNVKEFVEEIVRRSVLRTKNKKKESARRKTFVRTYSKEI